MANITLSITGDTAAEILKEVEAFAALKDVPGFLRGKGRSDGTVGEATGETGKAAETAKAGKSSEADDASENKKAGKAAKSAKEDKDPDQGSEVDCRNALREVNSKFDLEEAQSLLKKFGVEKVKELPTEKHADFIKACKKKLNEAEL